MGTFPTTPRSAFLAWCVAHKDPWDTNAASVGLSPAFITRYKADCDAAVAAVEAQEAAKQAAKAATTAANDAVATLRRTTTEGVRLIRIFAENAAKPATVYSLAEIPPPATPAPLPAPGKPSSLSLALDTGTGALELRWKCVNPAGSQGTSYVVYRKLPTQTTFSFVGVSGTRRFVDQTFTAGPDSVQYRVQAQRADATGPMSDILNIMFGVGGGAGFSMETITDDTLIGNASERASAMRKAA